MTKYLNHEAFDIVTNDAAYWIGFLFADGSVIQQKKSAPIVQLRLSEVDRGQPENFRKFLSSAHAIGTSPPGNFGGYQSRASVRFSVTSERLAGRLLEMGRYEGPIAPELAVSRHFWRGVVDGDGSIFVLRRGYSGIKLVGSQRLLDTFLGFLRERNLSGRMTVSPHKGIHEIGTAGHLAELIIDELYRNATTALARKAAAAGPMIESVRARRIQAANDADELRRRYEAGATLVELGRHYGVSNVTILRHMRRLASRAGRHGPRLRAFRSRHEPGVVSWRMGRHQECPRLGRHGELDGAAGDGQAAGAVQRGQAR